MRRLKVCPDGSACMVWDYATLVCNLYNLGCRPRYASPKRCHSSETFRAQSPLNPFYIWSNMLLTGMHYSTVVSIPLLLPLLRPSSKCTRVKGNYNNNTIYDIIFHKANEFSFAPNHMFAGDGRKAQKYGHQKYYQFFWLLYWQSRVFV